MSDLKETAIKIIRSLPDDTNWQDIMEQFYFRMKVDQGLREANNNETTPWEDVKVEFE